MPDNVSEVAGGLIYRDFITVGLLVDELLVSRDTPAGQEADRRQLDLHPGTRRAGRPVADFQQLEPGHGRRSEQSLDRDWNISATKPTPIWKQSDEEMTRLADRRAGKDRHHRRGRRPRRDRDPHAEDLSRLFRRLRAVRRNPRSTWTGSRTCSWSAATACTNTTTRTTRCSRPWWRSTTSRPADSTKPTSGPSTPSRSITKSRTTSPSLRDTACAG